MRALPRYRKLLRAPVIHAIDHVVALVDGLPPPLAATRESYGEASSLTVLFASADRMLEVLVRDPALCELREGPAGDAAGQVMALLLAERMDRQVMGMELQGDMLRRDVAQVAVSFRGHRLVDPTVAEADTRRQLKRRGFDNLLSAALQRIGEARSERADLNRQRALLRRKLDALEQGGWSFDPPDAVTPQPAALQTELEETERQLAALGADDRTLHAHLDITAAVLADAERQLWSETVELHLDRMNIQRDAQDDAARQVSLQELHTARGHRLVMLLIGIALDGLPRREDFFAAAQRVLG
jgi:hypothetical protein